MEQRIKRIKPELLSPAGSIEMLKAALGSGADAVYMGGSFFGARAYAKNPNDEELLSAIDLAHRLGKKLYLTVNTLLKNPELEDQLGRWLERFYIHGLDAVIIQDAGVAGFIHSNFPGLPMHASTQMFVTGPSGAGLLKKVGFRRVIAARECTLEEIRSMTASGLEVECFIHGAMCYAYSGQCLMSSMIGNRSGNRGRCAGICRLPFSVFSSEGAEIQACKKSSKQIYPLNMKDLEALGLLPELIDAGIASFKIEGRMKKPEYAAGVTSVYRSAIDRACAEPENYRPLQEEKKILLGLFNRDGFTEGYFKRKKSTPMVALENRKLSRQENVADPELYARLQEKLASKEFQRHLKAPLAARFTASLSEGASLVIDGRYSRVRIDYSDLQKSRAHPLTRERVMEQLNRTGNSPYRFEKLEISLENGLFMPVSSLNQMRKDAFEKLEKDLHAHFQRTANQQEPSEQIPKVATHPADSEQPAVLISRKNTFLSSDSGFYCMPETYEQLEALLRLKLPVGFYLREDLIRRARDARLFNLSVPSPADASGRREGDPPVRLVLPYVLTPENRKRVSDHLRLYAPFVEKILVRNLEEAALADQLKLRDKVILDAGLYLMNNQAGKFYQRLGFTQFTYPWELSFPEMRTLSAGPMELILYGRIPMMITRNCIQNTMRGCTRDFPRLTLKDRKNAAFPVFCDCTSCTNRIYNSLPFSLLKESSAAEELLPSSFRLEFTTETPKEAVRILSDFWQVYREKQKIRSTNLTTRGHFHRPVE